MKNPSQICIMFFVSLLSMAGIAQADTGNDLFRACGNGLKSGVLNRGTCHGFVSGVANTLILSRQICNTQGMTQTQMMMVVQNYMRQHPEMLNQDATVVVGQALAAGFPCS